MLIHLYGPPLMGWGSTEWGLVAYATDHHFLLGNGSRKRNDGGKRDGRYGSVLEEPPLLRYDACGRYDGNLSVVTLAASTAVRENYPKAGKMTRKRAYVVVPE